MTTHFALRSRRVVTSDGVAPATVVVRDGRIDAVLGADARPACPVEDLGEKALLPGLVDTHVHINEPGRTEWEGFATATRAAAAGGVTTLVDMPLNCSPVTTTVAALEQKLAAAEGKLSVDVGFWGGLVPGNTADLEPLARRGVLGFKCFMIHSGIDEFLNAGEAELRAGMPILARLGLPLLAHAELQGPGTAGKSDSDAPKPGSDPRNYKDYAASRPHAWERRAVEMLCRLSIETGCWTHVVHLASSEALGDLRARWPKLLDMSVETCPHYLLFADDEVPDGATEYKCAPPIRDAKNRDALWEGLREGIISIVASDHSPAPPELKKRDSGDFRSAWGGIASLEVGLPAIWTEARRRGFTLETIAAWMAWEPARLAGLDQSKGWIEAGNDADLVVFDPDARWTIDGAKLQHRHKLTPYHGRAVEGRVERTYLRGEVIFDGGRFAAEPLGRPILRPEPRP